MLRLDRPGDVVVVAVIPIAIVTGLWFMVPVTCICLAAVLADVPERVGMKRFPALSSLNFSAAHLAVLQCLTPLR